MSPRLAAVSQLISSMRAEASAIDLLLEPVHRWVWADVDRRARKLMRFSETEADGARDLMHAAERTSDKTLRVLYLRHADDEQRHAVLFRKRGQELFDAARARTFEANWLAPGERGLDDLDVGSESDESLLAFLHLSEKVAAGRFVVYEKVLACDPQTHAVFARILKDRGIHNVDRDIVTVEEVFRLQKMDQVKADEKRFLA